MPPSTQVLSLRPAYTSTRAHTNAKRANEVSANLNEANILPEGVTRRRKKTDKTEAYATELEKSSQGHLDAFYTAFSLGVSSAFVTSIGENNFSKAVPGTQHARLHQRDLPPEPQTYHQMTKHPHSKGFIEAIETEISSLQKKNTWTVVGLDHASKAKRVPIPTTWIFKYKFDKEGFLVKYKARLCARGDFQHTEQDTFAATLAARIFRALMALVAAFDMEIRQYDAVSAFLNSLINEPTYCKPPEGWDEQSILFLLLKALYGLKQSSALWYRHFLQTMIELGLLPVPGVECLFKNDYLLLFFFVDDIVVAYQIKDAKKMDEFQKKLFSAYEMKYLGPLQ